MARRRLTGVPLIGPLFLLLPLLLPLPLLLLLQLQVMLLLLVLLLLQHKWRGVPVRRVCKGGGSPWRQRHANWLLWQRRRLRNALHSHCFGFRPELEMQLRICLLGLGLSFS